MIGPLLSGLLLQANSPVHPDLDLGRPSVSTCIHYDNKNSSLSAELHNMFCPTEPETKEQNEAKIKKQDIRRRQHIIIILHYIQVASQAGSTFHTRQKWMYESRDT